MTFLSSTFLVNKQYNAMQWCHARMVLGIAHKSPPGARCATCYLPLAEQILARAKSVVQQPHSQTTSAQLSMTPSICVNACPAACALRSGNPCRVHIA